MHTKQMIDINVIEMKINWMRFIQELLDVISHIDFKMHSKCKTCAHIFDLFVYYNKSYKIMNNCNY